MSGVFYDLHSCSVKQLHCVEWEFHSRLDLCECLIRECACFDCLIDWQLGSGPCSPIAPMSYMTCPLGHISILGSPLILPNFQMAPSLTYLNILWFQQKQSRYTCLSEANSFHSQREWAAAELHNELSDSPIM
jgi:hypothetical protein